ncbi:MAG: hypothetical protein Q6370_021310 [Candidatus Sigynarchaeota archaeon]
MQLPGSRIGHGDDSGDSSDNHDEVANASNEDMELKTTTMLVLVACIAAAILLALLRPEPVTVVGIVK